MPLDGPSGCSSQAAQSALRVAPMSSSDHRTLRPVSGYAGAMEELREALAGVYDIEAPIGRGGMAFVYLARERRLDRRGALQELAPPPPPPGKNPPRGLPPTRAPPPLPPPHN